MKNAAFVMMLTLGVIAWTSARADDRRVGDGTLPEYLAIYDVDGDGVISVEERQAMEAARQQRHDDWVAGWDSNGDGVIDDGEKDEAQDAMRDQIEQTRTNRFNEADIDGDGCLTIEEFSAIPAVAELAQEHPEEPAVIYARLDANHDDCVSVEEFTACLRQQPEEWRTEETYTAADIDADDCLTFEEFSAISNVVRLAQHEPEEPARLYARLDANHDNCLSLEEFTADIHMGDHRGEWRTAAAYAAADSDTNGCLTLEEFSAIPEVARREHDFPGSAADLYGRLDADDDSCLSLAEFTAELEHDGDIDDGDGEHHDGPWRTPETYATADVNGDHCLTFAEFGVIPQVVEIAVEHPGAPADMYDRLDMNHDDCLSLLEFTAPDDHDGPGGDDGPDGDDHSGPGPGR